MGGFNLCPDTPALLGVSPTVFRQLTFRASVWICFVMSLAFLIVGFMTPSSLYSTLASFKPRSVLQTSSPAPF